MGGYGNLAQMEPEPSSGGMVLELDPDKLNRWFTEKWKHGPCPVCETNLWTPLPRLGMVPNLTPTGLGTTNVVPVLLVGCANCGYMLHINALAAGLLKEPDLAAELAAFTQTESAEQAAKAGR
jgi:hypothetical protein